MAMWTPEYIRALKEDDLSRSVLIPLFEAMGYRDVRFHGGGVLEQGKDLTMWLEHEPSGRKNFAAVVKAVAITGEASTAMTISQLRQAFAVPFRDSVTGAEVPVHECFVVTSKPMKKEGIAVLHNLIRAEPFWRYVVTIDGDTLWDLIQKHLGPRVTLGTIIENYRTLNSRPDYDVSLALNASWMELRVRSKKGRSLELNMPSFPATPEGAANRASYERFLRTGEPVELDAAHIDPTSGDSVLADLGVIPTIGVVRVARADIRAFSGDLRCVSDSGEEVVIPGLAFKTRGGTQRFTITNEQQRTPLHFAFDITRENASVENARGDGLSMVVSLPGWSIYWYVKYLQLLRVAANQCAAYLRDAETGIEDRLGILKAARGNPPTKEHVDIAKRFLRVQETTRQPILIPQREFFTAKDIEGLEFVEEVIATGRQKAESISFVMTSTQGEAEFWRKHFGGPVDRLKIRTENISRLVLETYVPLGPMEVSCVRGRLTASDPELAIQDLANGKPHELTVVPTERGRIVADYPNWRKT